jgi:hypothetical protein
MPKEQHFDKYIQRGEFKSRRWKSDSLNIIKNTVGKFNDSRENDLLDIRLRGDRVHVYYRGGKILDVTSTGYEFEEKYITDNSDEFIEKWGVNKKGTFTSKVNNDMIGYFKEASKIMDHWFRSHPKDEREHQHKIAVYNQPKYKIVDIEFAVSFNSRCYNKKYMDKCHGGEYDRYPNPRFDIIAIDADGQIFVLELKTGCGATKNMKKHVEDFIHMIGSEDRYQYFLKELKQMIDSYNEKFGREYPNINLNQRPKFYFAYTEKDEEGLESFKMKVKETCAALKGVPNEVFDGKIFFIKDIAQPELIDPE